LILTFDADGVIVEAVDGIDNNPDARNVQAYFQKGLAPGFDVGAFNKLLSLDTIYVVSARSFPKAAAVLTDWLFSYGIDVDRLQGVLCAEGTNGRLHEGSHRKADIVRWLGSDLHIDDHPDIIRELGNRGVLVRNPLYPENIRAYEREHTDYYRARHLADVLQIIERTRETRRLS
jgi:hypothetical protein